MNEGIESLLDKAKRSQKAAAKLFKDGDVDFAASRAYYSLFYTASALLLSRGLFVLQSFWRDCQFWKRIREDPRNGTKISQLFD